MACSHCTNCKLVMYIKACASLGAHKANREARCGRQLACVTTHIETPDVAAAPARQFCALSL
eukprot:scaffold1085_cov407-Prasinococcus_capsulatus_cf.AAC.32